MGAVKNDESGEAAEMSFSLPFRTPKRKQGLGQSPSAAI